VTFRKVFLAFFTLSATLLASQLAFGQETKPFTANRHITAGLECKSCHGEGKKQPVTGDKCLECHTSFEEVAKRTQDMKPNPHENHITESTDLDCTKCHQGHKADVVYCTNCHTGLTFKRSSAPAAPAKK
jgi:fumarate reductase flavoprotein subunit